MKKELTIRLDTQEFDKSVADVQRKLKELQQPSDQSRSAQTSQRLQQAGYGPLAGAPSSADASKNINEYKRNLEALTRTEKSALEEKIRNTTKYRTILDDISKNEKASIEMRMKAQKDLDQALKEELEKEIKINAILNERDRIKKEGTASSAPRGGTPPDPKDKRAISIPGIPTMVAGITGAIASATTIMSQIESARAFVSNVEQRTTIASAQAFNMQGAAGQRLGSMFAGKGIQEFAWDPEKRKADEEAEKMMKGKYESPFGIETLRQRGDLSGDILALMSHPGTRSTWESVFGTEKSYQAAKEAERAGLSAEQLEALKSGPEGKLKGLTMERYYGNLERDVGFQRSLGLNTQQLRGEGGFIPGAVGAGFTPEMAMQSSQAILAAGGSTLAARQSPFALKAQRAFDLTNASQLMGQVGGAVGGESAKQAMISMLASGTAAGLDQSDYREENRKYLEGLASVIARSGARTTEDFDRLSGLYGGFVAEKTPAGIKAAQSAYQLYNQAATEKTGPRAVARQAALLGYEAYGSLSFTTQQALSNLSPEQMSFSHPAVIQASRESGKTPAEIVSMYKDAQDSSMMIWDVNKGRGLQKQARTTRDLLSQAKASGDTVLQKIYGEALKGTTGEYGTYLAAQPGFEALGNPRMMETFEQALEGGASPDQALSRAKERIRSEMEAGPTRPEDVAIAGQAQFEGDISRNVLDFTSSLSPATDAVKEFASSLMDATLAARGASSEERNAARLKSSPSFQREAREVEEILNRELSPGPAPGQQNASSMGSKPARDSW